MKLVLAFLGLSTFIFTACAMETGSVIELKLSPSADRGAIEDALRAVAGEMGMIVEGPENGPSGIVEYRASYPGESSTIYFFIKILMSERRSVLIRTMNNQIIDSTIPERALDLFREEFANRGIKFELRRG